MYWLPADHRSLASIIREGSVTPSCLHSNCTPTLNLGRYIQYLCSQWLMRCWLCCTYWEALCGWGWRSVPRPGSGVSQLLYQLLYVTKCLVILTLPLLSQLKKLQLRRQREGSNNPNIFTVSLLQYNYVLYKVFIWHACINQPRFFSVWLSTWLCSMHY